MNRSQQLLNYSYTLHFFLDNAPDLLDLQDELTYEEEKAIDRAISEMGIAVKIVQNKFKEVTGCDSP